MIAANCDDAFNKIGWLLRDLKRRPAQLCRRRVGFIERSAADQAVVDAPIRPVYDRRLNTIGPGVTIFRACGRKRGAGNLLGIKAERRPLRRVATDGQRAGDGLGDEMIAKARLVSQRCIAGFGFVFDFMRLGFCVFHDLGHGTSQIEAAIGPRGRIGLERN